MFTGGPYETNCYLIPTSDGSILVDAPEGAGRAFADRNITLLVLTHGHFDHFWDAAEIVRRHQCRVAAHLTTEQIIADKGLLRRLGIDLELEPVKVDRYLSEGEVTLNGKAFMIHEVPGHCPGSICLEDVVGKVLYGGDVLFANGVGRWDLPGGDRDLLLSGIKGKLLPLHDRTIVLSGHGPATTIGAEKSGNPYLQ